MISLETQGDSKIGSSVKNGEELVEFFKVCCLDFVSICSLLIKPEVGSYRRESTHFLWLWNEIPVDLGFEYVLKAVMIFLILLYIQYNFCYSALLTNYLKEDIQQ